MAARTKNRGLVFLRRSSGKQESSLQVQLEWAIREAAKLQVVLDASVTDLEFMQSRGEHSYKSIRLDDAKTGADLERAGFLTFKADVLTDKSISHVFLIRRDRLARPEDATKMVSIEKEIRQSGVTFVMADKIGKPLDVGLPDIGEEISMWIDYYESGEFLRKHAERVISSKIILAKAGNWTGGRAPYGFARVLVKASGEVREELVDGRRVREPGCHVRIMPKDKDKLAIWSYILDLKHKGWGAPRIAQHLNGLGIPSPDAGRTRTDHGVKHLVSGKWSTRSVLELCRNPAIIGELAFGRRSDGAHRRLGKDGPRLLNQKDRDANDRPKLIRNNKEDRITTPTGFASQYEVTKWNEINRQMDERGKNQAGIPRSKDPARYPLATRVIDLTDGCGSIMYARTSGERRQYVCGRYTRTNFAECHNNTVDADALLRSTIQDLKQLVVLAGGREHVRRRLKESIEAKGAAAEKTTAERETEFLKGNLRQLTIDLATMDRRMAREGDDNRYAMIACQRDLLLKEISDIETKIGSLVQEMGTVRTVEADVDEAMRLFEEITALTEDDASRLKIGEIVRRIGLWIGLNYAAGVKGTKRQVRVLQGGIMTFGNEELPVRLFGNQRVDPNGGALTVDGRHEVRTEEDCVQTQPGVVTASGPMPEAAPPGPFESRQEGISYTKVSRGDRASIELFLSGCDRMIAGVYLSGIGF